MKSEHPKQESPTDAYGHAVESLDLIDVLEHIASKCSNDGAKRSVRELRPATDRSWIDAGLREIREVCDYHESEGRLAMVDTSIQGVIRKAQEHRETIDPAGLLAVMAIERSVVETKKMFRDARERFPRLSGIVSRMTEHQSLVDAIERCIDRDQTIKDSASRKLADLRKRVGRAKDDIRHYTDKLAKSLGSPEYATFTGSRYLLLVPREKCRQKDGIVHSTSHSGGSLYFEPFSLVEKNNTLETIALDARAEEARILDELTTSVLDVAGELFENMELWELLDGLNAKAGFATEFKCSFPGFSQDGSMRLVNARHPLLELSLRQRQSADDLVPLNLTLDNDSRVLVITGPNAGGKTVTLKTVGVVALLFQCGLPVPCDEGSTLPVFDKVFADIGDEQSIASSLSTFTSHLRHLDFMCKTASDRALCLIDEIGDGTDPEEGAALAIATLEHLVSAGAAVVASTHYGKVKTFALDAGGVSNASMLFDDENDRPLYRLLQGTAGRSRGIETARRLDFFEPVIRRAMSMLGEETFRLEVVLTELETTKLAIEQQRASLEKRSRDLDEMLQSYSAKEREITEFREAHERRAREQAEQLLLDARKEIEGIVKEIRETSAAKSSVRESHARLGKLLERFRTEPKKPQKVARVRVGDRVSMSPTGEPSGRVTAVKGRSITVEIRGKTINTKTSAVYRVESDSEEGEGKTGVDVSVEPLRATSIDVRGKDREEALTDVDLFLDRAVLGGVAEVTIIHGLGGEVLLAAIRSRLKSDPRVKSVRSGQGREGGRGVSVVQLK